MGRKSQWQMVSAAKEVQPCVVRAQRKVSLLTDMHRLSQATGEDSPCLCRWALLENPNPTPASHVLVLHLKRGVWGSKDMRKNINEHYFHMPA